MNPVQQLAVLVAASENDIIGNDGDLPWHISADLKRFKRLTMGHHIIMGRKTFESIGRLLPGRTTVIVTRQTDYAFADIDLSEAKIVASIEAAILACEDDPCPFIVGGAQIYELAIPLITQIYLTRVHATILGDTKLPAIEWEKWDRESV